MSYMLWLFVGAVLGWLATVIIRNRRRDLLFNIAVGMAGAFVAGYLLTPVFHFNKIYLGIFSLPALLNSLIGAVILLAAVNFFRRENNVNNSVIEGQWKHISSRIQDRWGKLTDLDIEKINNHHDQFNITIQERYGYTKNKAEDQIQRYIKAVLRI